MSAAFVSSTLPLSIIYKNVKIWGIDTLIISHVSLKKSYELIAKNYLGIKLIVIPEFIIFNFLYLLITLLIYKLKKKDIYFFHECCWVNFDVLVNLINNKGFFYPQVTMESFNRTNKGKISKDDLIIKIFSQKDNFIKYKYTKGNLLGTNFIHSCIKYNSQIKVNSVKTSNKYKLIKKFKKTKAKKALFIVGNEPMKNENLIFYFNYFSNLLQKNGYQIFIKDHPNVNARLNINNDLIGLELEPHIPVEMLEDDFDFVFGCASSGLIKFKNRAFSIIDLTDMDLNEKKIRKKHLLSLEDGKHIIFLNKKCTMSELREKKLNTKNF